MQKGKLAVGGIAQSGATLSESGDIGAVVHYDDDGGILNAIVIGTKKEKLLLYNERDRELELGRGRLYFLPGKELAVAQGASNVRKQFFADLTAKVAAAEGGISIPELWSFIHEEPRVYAVHELCELYLGANTREKHAALRIALIKERVHFKRDRDGFEPRSAQVVEDLQKAEVARHKKEAIREATVNFFKKKARATEEPIPDEARENIWLLEKIASNAQHLDVAQMKEGKELVHLGMQALGLQEANSIERAAFAILERIGHFNANTNLSFIRFDIPVEHPQAAIDEGNTLTVFGSIEQYPEDVREGREDLTRIRTFTIDDITTKDMDDALSIEQTIDGFQVGIHITDVASIIPAKSDLDTSAARRTTSLYCADKTVHMLPPAISQEKLSLKEGTLRPCLSCLVDISRDFSITGHRIVRSWIKSAERLTYDFVDEQLESGEHNLLTLHEFAVACEEIRNANGAMRVHKREVVPHLEDDGRVSLKEIDEDSPARSLVAEMMVLANTLFAAYAAEHDVPILFRGQEKPDEETSNAQNDAPSGPAKDFGGRVRMKKSTVGLTPLPHAGLGVAAYTQMTSPIRRYMDLCHQRQIITHLRTGKPWLEASEFEQLAQGVEVFLQEATVASRETRRFWLLRYLEQRPRSAPIEGTVVRLDMKAPLIELDEVYITLFARSSARLKLGDRVTMKILGVDPHGDYVRLEVV